MSNANNPCHSSHFPHPAMPSWTHLVQSLTIEDSQVHLGQLVDTTRDAGRDSADGLEIAVYVIDGTVFDGRVTDQVLHVKSLSRPCPWFVPSRGLGES
jgi:hypothetical protein